MTEHRTEADAVAQIAVEGAEPFNVGVGDGQVYIVRGKGGEVSVFDLESYADGPRDKRGTFTTFDAPSFLAYIGKHSTADTEIWADQATSSVVAVIDAHGATAAGHGRHRTNLTLRQSVAWQRWTANDRKVLAQVAFAEHVEDRLIDIATPPAADMLELVQTFTAKRELNFESGRALSTGQVQLEYRETINAQAGHKGRLEIPQRFTLRLPVFVGADPVEVTARLRYRIADQTLLLGYFLDRPEDVERLAFDAVVDHIAANLADGGPPILSGRPA